jgi:hypothetical protein
MIDARLPLLLLLLPASVGAQDRSRAKPAGRASVAAPPANAGARGSFVIQQRVIVRVPRLPVGRMPLATRTVPPPPIKWVEKRGEKCVAVGSLAGAAITRADSVDLVLSGGKRVRARLADNCPALDFYSGFYLKPAGDGMVCSSRDAIRSRSGGSCRIVSFRTLVPAR